MSAATAARALAAVEGGERLPASFRRVAVLGGIYSNHLALARALGIAQGRGAEGVFCLGDLGGFGPHPDRTCDLLRDHKVRVMAGNYDVSVAAGLDDCGCGYTDPRDNRFAQISYDYTLARTSAGNRLWMAGFPPGFRFRLGDVEVLACHGSPRRVNEFLWESGTPDGLIRHFLDAAGARLLLATHTGIKWDRRLPDGRGFVNVGVLGRPENDGTPRVWFTLLEADPALGWKAEFVPVGYEHEALAAEMRAEGLPEEFTETIVSGWWTTCLEILPAKERARGRF
jgi:hypothetical protein